MKSKTTINLRIPGPTPLPPEVLSSLSAQMINHRGHAYEEIQKRVVENLKYFFQTENDIFLLTSSGMGGLEAAIVNFFSPGDRIVSFTCGEFGNRWADVARSFGADVLQIKFTPGQVVSATEVKRVMAAEGKIAGVLVTLNETASAVLNPIREIAPIVKSQKSKPLLLIDGISGLGAVDLPMDKLDIDVLVTAAQKAWMAPPGMAMIGVSPLAWERHTVAKMPRYYFDISQFKKFAEKNQTPATPAVTVLYGLDTGLKMMREKGREKVFQTHLELRDYVRNKIRQIGLKLFVADKDASLTLTSILIPEGVDGHKWLEILREKYGVVLAGGMGETKGKIIRIAHMGYVSYKDLDEAIEAMEKSLEEINRH